MQKKRYERLGARYGTLVVMIFVVCAVILGLVVSAYFFTKTDFSRMTVVSIGDPVIVWSQDIQSKRFVTISIPANAEVDAVGGYGRYSLDALWKLGSIDSPRWSSRLADASAKRAGEAGKKNGTLVSDSLEEALGISIPWYIDASRGRWLPRTNMPLLLLFSWLWRTRDIRPDQITTISLRPETALAFEDVPDGTKVAVVDPVRVDVLLGSLFEDERIRREHLSVTVYNTTDMPTLGSRVGRMLNHIGVFVVRVGNDSPPVDACTVSGEKAVIQSVTARTMASIFHCQILERSSEAGDLDIRVGTRYQARFLPAPH